MRNKDDRFFASAAAVREILFAFSDLVMGSKARRSLVKNQK